MGRQTFFSLSNAEFVVVRGRINLQKSNCEKEESA